MASIGRHGVLAEGEVDECGSLGKECGSTDASGHRTAWIGWKSNGKRRRMLRLVCSPSILGFSSIEQHIISGNILKWPDSWSQVLSSIVAPVES